MRDAGIAALQRELPETRVSDQELAGMLGCSKDVVSAASGGRDRFYSSDGEGPANLAVRAASRILADAGLMPADVGLIVFATSAGDLYFPGSACVMQPMLLEAAVTNDAGAGEEASEGGSLTSACLDVRSLCTGFVAALDVARRFVATGMYDHALVAAADTPSHIFRYDGVTPDLTARVSDGAAVALVSSENIRWRVLSSRSVVDGSRQGEFFCEIPAARNLEPAPAGEAPGAPASFERRARVARAQLEAGRHFPTANLEAMRRTAREKIPVVLGDALREAGADSVDVSIVAHLDAGLAASAADWLPESAGRVISSNTLFGGGYSLPAAMVEAEASGALDGAGRVALLTAGGGASWGAVILEANR